jgi:hypothetical protein
VGGSLDASDCELIDSSGGRYYADRYVFDAIAGDEIVFEIVTATFDTFMQMRQPDGTFVVNDDSRGTLFSRIPPDQNTLRLAQSGRYVLDVTTFAPLAIGTYSLAANLNRAQQVPICTINGVPAGTLAAGVVFTLRATCSPAATNYEWVSESTDARGLAPSGDSIVVQPFATHTYRVRGVNASGVRGPEATASVKVTATPSDSDGDGIPDSIEASNGLDPTLKDNDLYASATLYIQQQYRDFFAREGDLIGVENWARAFSANQVDRASLAEVFLDSQEFQTKVAPLFRLYQAVFLRLPDLGGLRFYVNDLTQYAIANPGTSLVPRLEVIANGMTQSQEFVNRYGSLPTNFFVDLVYRNVLGRSPDAAGFAFWVDAISAGRVTRGQMVYQFSDSAEYRFITANSVNVSMVYLGLLQRTPDDAGLNFWVSQIRAGRSIRDLISQFITLPEYRARFLSAQSPVSGTPGGLIGDSSVANVRVENAETVFKFDMRVRISDGAGQQVGGLRFDSFSVPNGTTLSAPAVDVAQMSADSDVLPARAHSPKAIAATSRFTLDPACFREESRGPSISALATMLLLDQSGSLTTTDPSNLRIAAAKLFAQAVNAQANGVSESAALAKFPGDSGQAFQLLSEYVSTPGGGPLAGLIDGLAGRASGATPLFAAGRAAASYANTNAPANAAKAMVLFTDGLPNFDDAPLEQSFVNDLRAGGIRLLAVGLGSGTDVALLARLAAATGGSYVQASVATQLVAAFRGLSGVLAGAGRYYRICGEGRAQTTASGVSVTSNILVRSPDGVVSVPFALAVK